MSEGLIRRVRSRGSCRRSIPTLSDTNEIITYKVLQKRNKTPEKWKNYRFFSRVRKMAFVDKNRRRGYNHDKHVMTERRGSAAMSSDQFDSVDVFADAGENNSSSGKKDRPGSCGWHWQLTLLSLLLVSGLSFLMAYLTRDVAERPIWLMGLIFTIHESPRWNS